MKSNIYTFGIPFGFSALAFFYYFFWKHEEKKPDVVKPTEKENSSNSTKDIINEESSHENSSQKERNSTLPSKSAAEIVSEPEIVQEQKKDILTSPTIKQSNGENSINLENANNTSHPNRLESDKITSNRDVESIDDTESTEDGAESTDVDAESSDVEIESSEEEVTANTEIDARDANIKDINVNGKDNLEATDVDEDTEEVDVKAADVDVEIADSDKEVTNADVEAAIIDTEASNADVKATNADVDAAKADVDAVKADVEATEADVDSAKADVDSAKADVEATKADVEATEADVEATKADVEATKADVEATKADVEATKADVEATEADVEAVEADVEATKADVEATEAEDKKYDVKNKDEAEVNKASIEDIETQIIVDEVEKINAVDTEANSIDMEVESTNAKIECVTAATNTSEEVIEDEEIKCMEDNKSEFRLADDSIEVLDLSTSFDDCNNVHTGVINLTPSSFYESKSDSSGESNGVDISAIMEKLTMQSTDFLSSESDSPNVTVDTLFETEKSDDSFGNGKESSEVKNGVNHKNCVQGNQKTNCEGSKQDSNVSNKNGITNPVSNGDHANANTTIDLSDSIIEVPNNNPSSSVAPAPFKLKPDFYGHQIFYSNHTLKETGFPFSDDGTPYDFQKVWEQPDDGMVFVKGSAGQPLVPNYLRNPKYLSERSIPAHEPNQFGFIARNMKAPSFRAMQWVRVISISQSLEIRVRHDQRDMLLDKLQKDGIIDQEAPPIRAANLEVGCLVGTMMNVPLQGSIWCRVIITQIIRGQDDMNRRGNRRFNPEPLFMFESIDYFPLKSDRPVNTQHMRALKKEALEAPFFDEIIYLTNSMPRNRQWYEKSARDALVKLVNQSDNYLYIKSNVGTHINGYYHSFAPLYARSTRGADKQEVLVQRHLLNLQHVVPIYEGLINDQIVYSLCMFKDNDAFWMDDDRYYDQVSSLWPKSDYIYVTHAHSARTTDLKGYQGFNIPFRHEISGFMQNDFNMTAQQYSQMHLHSRPQDQFSNQHLRDILLRKDVPLDCNFLPQTYVQLFMTDITRRTQTDQLVNNEFFVAKDRNGFLLLRYL